MWSTYVCIDECSTSMNLSFIVEIVNETEGAKVLHWSLVVSPDKGWIVIDSMSVSSDS
jgi:hypothetical protein